MWPHGISPVRSVRYVPVLALVLIVLPLCAGEAEEPPKLLGACTVEELGQEPYSEWFQTGYDDYEPNPAALRALGAIDQSGVEMELFFGAWCGDSRREVPRMLKLFDAMGLPRERVELIGVDAGEGVHKRSPGGEERGLEIYRVPTLVVRRDGTEIARIVEFPVLSLERDLLAILTGAHYEPNYRSYPVVRRWLIEGLLADPNVSPRGLANEVRHRVATEGELAAAAGVLLERGQIQEAIKLTQVNCSLYRESSRCFARLAGAQLVAGQSEAARESVQRALRLNTEPDLVSELLELLEPDEPREK